MAGVGNDVNGSKAISAGVDGTAGSGVRDVVEAKR